MFARNNIKRRAFTLIEILVTVAIIGVLATALIVNMASARSRSRDARRKADLKSIFNAIEMLYDNGTSLYPVAEAGNGAIRPRYSELVPKYLPEALADPSFRPSNTTGVRTDYAYAVMGRRDSFAIGGFLENPSGYSCRLGTSIVRDITTMNLGQDIGNGPATISSSICK